jgi:CubicO group peptidase (beta-lactamase class C family)
MDELFQQKLGRDDVVPANAITAFLKDIEKSKVNMHGFIMLSHGVCVAEGYWKPFHQDSLHRMYSAGKSFTSLAIGLLQEEGKLNIDDPICQYFEDKLGAEVHPWIQETTIKHMLCMTTPHQTTTYKRYQGDWVESFFRVAPTHKPGTIFSYDTSATHVLAALVEKLSGVDLMSYLRVKAFDAIGVSKESLFLKDPAGISQGGSGLMCTLRDLVLVAQLCMNEGVYQGKSLLPKDYLQEATDYQVPTVQQPFLDEQFGYGYQIWKSREDGFCFYGMGGQLALCFPKYRFILGTMADTIGNPNGLKDIYDAFYDNVYEYLKEKPELVGPSNESEYEELRDRISQLTLQPISGSYTSSTTDKINHTSFQMVDNEMSFDKVQIHLDSNSGILEYEKQSMKHQLEFGLGEFKLQKFPNTTFDCITSAAWLQDNLLFLRCYVIEECFAHLDISIRFIEDTITIGMKRTEEEFLVGYNGITTGQRIKA